MNGRDFIRQEIKNFFKKNPNAFTSVKGLTTRINKEEQYLSSVIEELVMEGYLKKIGEGSEALYLIKKK